MRLLLVSGIRPWDPFGGALRVRQVATALAELGIVDLLVLPLNTNHGDGPPPDLFDRVRIVPMAYSPLDQRRGLPRRWFELTMGAGSAQVRKMRQRILRSAAPWLRAESYDLVWYMREHVWLMTRDLINAPSVVDVDDLRDVVLQRWLSLRLNEKATPATRLQRLQMIREISWWERVHRMAADRADTLVLSSEVDRRRFPAGHTKVVPNTYQIPGPPGPGSITEQQDGAAGGRRPTILFQGILRWGPNADAATRLVEEIALAIRVHFPDLRIVLAGKSSERIERLARHPGVEVTGQVPSMLPYLRDADIVAVPLRIGGGTRIKILEAFAHRVPVVSTSIGAEGIEVEAGVHLEIADTTAAFARQCIRVLQGGPAVRAMAERAYSLYAARYSPAQCVRAVGDVVASTLRSDVSLSAGTDGGASAGEACSIPETR